MCDYHAAKRRVEEFDGETMQEERLAWDRYATAFASTLGEADIWNEDTEEVFAGHAASFADQLLEERRKRFGALK